MDREMKIRGNNTQKIIENVCTSAKRENYLDVVKIDLKKTASNVDR